jgi:sulfur-carrier protein
MVIKIVIPTPLRASVSGKHELEYNKEDTIYNILIHFSSEFPKLKQYLLSSDGRLQKFVNFYVNEVDIRDLKNELTQLKDGDVLSIIPAIAGGF